MFNTGQFTLPLQCGLTVGLMKMCRGGKVCGMIDPAHIESQVAPLLSSLAEFTEQREQDALSTSLGRAIRDLTDATAVTLYHLSTVEEAPVLTPIAAWHRDNPATLHEHLQPASPLSTMPMFETCLASQQITHYQDERTASANLILPLSGPQGKVGAFFLVECLCSDEIAQRVLPLLLEIYRNFLDLLRDNQHDLLTGLLNRKTFDTRISTVLSTLNHPHHRKTDDSPEGFCLAILDIDHFKRINDNYGHLYGDEVLLLMSNMMKESFREGDALFRFGGEEFVVLLKNVDPPRALKALERFRKKVETRTFPQVGQVTVSCGSTRIRPNELPPQIIDRADRALYFAKGHGRNQVCAYEALVEQGLLQSTEIISGDIELF